MAQWFGALAGPAEDPGSNQTRTWQLKIICNSSSRRSPETQGYLRPHVHMPDFKIYWPGVGVHSFNPSTRETELGGSL